jgi:DNA-binding CsgD family transcriptional regulator
MASGNLAALLQRTGPLTRARALLERALVLTDSNDAGQRSRLLNVAANIAIFQDRVDDAFLTACHAREHAQGRVACWLELTTARALQHLGRYIEAGAAIERAEGLIAPDDLVNAALVHTSRAWLHILQQSYNRAWESCGHALACVSPQRHQWLYYPALAINGVLLRERGQLAEAEVTLREAAVWPRRTGDLSAIISIEWHLAALYDAMGNEQCRAEHLSAALSAMHRGEFATALLWQPARVAELCAWAIEQEIEAPYATWILRSMTGVEAGLPVNPVARPDARLTPREREVLELAADGLRDAEIARRLRLSVRTVHNHLQRCYEKLGAHSRAEAVQYMQQD